MSTLDIQAERCVHQQVADARCQACVQACPHHAWRMHENGLGFDPDACDDCGLCVAVCPTEALRLAAPVARVAVDDAGARTLLLACERAGLSVAVPGVTACLYALAPGWLLHQCETQHAASVTLSAGDCARCSRGRAGTAWRAEWQAAAARWRAVERPVPALRAVSPTAWLARAENQPLANPGRRRWLMRRTPDSAVASEANAQPALGSARQWLIEQTVAPPATAVAARPLWAVRLDDTRCTACLACVRLCPTPALQVMEATPEAPAQLALDLQHCIGCGLCSAVCDAQALSDPWPVADAAAPSAPGGDALQPRQWPLASLRCSTCQHVFHRLASHAPAAGTRCPACQAGRPMRYNRLVEPGPAA